jgi:lipopolysaccharide/colanic/teichoic acid biosynthesis glycosyltransferase
MLEDTLVSGYARLAAETPRRRIDLEVRALDVVLAALFGLLLLPVALAIAAAILVADGRPVLYRGQRVGRHGHFFTIAKRSTRASGAG